ncbi:helix-turn-helix transcriptional regulator [Nostoc sp. UHCC 0302]|uniref:helix-turn-helix transcriptional regulator n=1 Tax=Nostoc sp. UHCC 0302 TaxID=3134896 RepID=UPI00311CD325
MTEIKNLHEFLGKHPMSHRDLAKLLCVSLSVVDKWSNGSRRITPRTIEQLNKIHESFLQNPQLRGKYVKTAQCAVI